jgi:hypothetical protein
MTARIGLGSVAASVLLAWAALASLSPDRALAACTTFTPNELHFQSGKAGVRARPYGHIAKVSGRVTCEDGTPFPFGGAVGMVEYYVLSTGALIGAGGELAVVQPDGSFSLTVKAGPSRRLYFAFAPPGSTVAYYNPGFLTFICRVRPRLHIRPKVRRVGRSVHFKGSLPGPFLSGRPAIAMQARTGHKWRTFKVVPLNPAGKFRAKYRFARTSQTTIYHFRAKPITGGVEYPFQARSSKQKKAIVHA